MHCVTLRVGDRRIRGLCHSVSHIYGSFTLGVLPTRKCAARVTRIRIRTRVSRGALYYYYVVVPIRIVMVMGNGINAQRTRA